MNAIGETVLKLLDDFYKQQGELNARGQKMLDGTLFWLVNEQKLKDTDGKKGYKYSFAYLVKTSEPKYTEEEIQQELRESYAKLKAETDEMYGDTTDEEYARIWNGEPEEVKSEK